MLTDVFNTLSTICCSEDLLLSVNQSDKRSVKGRLTEKLQVVI